MLGIFSNSFRRVSFSSRRSYSICNPNQNSAELPKNFERRNAVSQDVYLEVSS